jgi:hypothetical protein
MNSKAGQLTLPFCIPIPISYVSRVVPAFSAISRNEKWREIENLHAPLFFGSNDGFTSWLSVVFRVVVGGGMTTITTTIAQGGSGGTMRR